MFKAPFQLPIISGTELFPQTTQNMPITRINVRLDGPIPAGVTTVRVQAAGEAIVKQHMGDVHHFLQAQRQHAHGGLEVIAKKLSLPPLTLYYTKMHGQETLTVDCLVTLTDLKSSENKGLCLLVLYDGNKIAAITMESIKTPSVVYKSTLKHSSWTTGSGYHDNSQQLTQIKFSKDFYPIMSSFSIVDVPSIGMTISVPHPPFYTCWDASAFLKPGAASGFTSNYYGHNGFSGFWFTNDVPPIINGSDNKVYFLGETFTRDPKTKKITYTAPSGDGIPTFTTASGDYCWGVDAVSGAPMQVSTGGGWTQRASADSAALSAAITAANTHTTSIGGGGIPDFHFPLPQTATGTNAVFYLSAGPNLAPMIISSGTSVVTTAYTWITGSTVTLNAGDTRLSTPRPVISSVKGFDVVTPVFSDFVATLTGFAHSYPSSDPAFILNYPASDQVITISYVGPDLVCENIFNHHWDPAIGDVIDQEYFTNSIYTYYQWPYWVGSSYFMNSIIQIKPSYSAPWGLSRAAVTPWGSYSDQQLLRGWLHVSNGTHMIQGAIVVASDGSAITAKSLYLDGKDYTTALTKALKVDISQIDAVLMDIDLDDIKKLV